VHKPSVKATIQKKSGSPGGKLAPSNAEVCPSWELYSKCIHCGLCLNHCPTYRLLGVEMDSPRGRIHQMILVDEGRLPLADIFVRHIDLCLDCRACETACPSGVQYGRLVEAARTQIEQHYRRPLLSRLAGWLGLEQVLPHPGRLALLGRLLRFYQRSGLQKVARASGMLRFFRKLGQAERLLPPLEDQFFFSELGRVYPPACPERSRGEPEGRRRARVAFFAGCIAQVAFAGLNRATVRVLQRNGCEVVVPTGQLCCGALHVHAGRRDTARQLARANLEAFLNAEPGGLSRAGPRDTGHRGFDAIITNAAGCGATLKEYAQLFAANDPWKAHAETFQLKVRDVSEFLVELGVRPPAKPVPLRVTYQDSCHLVHAQKIRNPPRELLRSIPGVELVEMKLADHCCGSAGIYNLAQPEVATQLLAEKMDCARATDAQAIVTANPGCLLQLRAGVEQFSTGQQVLHVVELLNQAYK
jgi:glycolate oxidase iron-sulfur subunit